MSEHLFDLFRLELLADLAPEYLLTHRFSFDERFDERMLSVYLYGFQYIKPSIHQFIGFSSLVKSAVEATEVNIAIRRLVGRTSGLPTDKGKPTPLVKRKR